jgi:DNA-binding LacI/PurR family transcriptional regulator
MPHGAKSDAVLSHRYTTSVARGLSTFRLDPRSSVGIAGQIRARIALLVADGELKPGALLPSVRTLARQLGVNVNTVRSAYARLEADGLVRTRQGVGTVVLPAGAGRLASGSTAPASNSVAVLIGGLDPFYLSLLRGIEDVADEQGTLVLITDTRDSPELADTVIRRLIARGVDGIVAVSVGGLENGAMPDPGRGDGRVVPPIVYVDQPDRKGYVLLFDGDHAGYLATRHLSDHGHESIGIVTPPLSWPNVREVYEGYVRALDEIGGGLSRTLVCEVEEFTLEAGRIGLARLLESSDLPSAVFAAGEVLALGVLQEARARGIDVPGDLAIIGYTDSPSAALVEPALTMVSVPAREIGVRAMRILQALIAGKEPRPRRTVLDVELVLRASCGSH